MRIILLVLFILLCTNLASLLLYYNRYMLTIAYEDFMNRLKEKLELKFGNDIIYKEYESLFGKYGPFMLYGLTKLVVYLFLIIEIAFLVIPILFQTCNKCCKICRAIISLLLLIVALFFSIGYLISSFKIKNRVNLTDEEIYIFDDEFNNEIKKNIKTMYDRKIYLITCRFFELAGIIAQFILIIIDLVKTYSNKNKNEINNDNYQVQNVIIYETERQKNNSEFADNAKQDNRDNKNIENN